MLIYMYIYIFFFIHLVIWITSHFLILFGYRASTPRQDYLFFKLTELHCLFLNSTCDIAHTAYPISCPKRGMVVVPPVKKTTVRAPIWIEGGRGGVGRGGRRMGGEGRRGW